jgi:hypothetical protein
VSQYNPLSLTLDQRTNIDGVLKAAELIEISGGHALEASDRAIMNMLYQHAHDNGRLSNPTASWDLPITALRPSKHNGTDRIRDSLSRLLSVQVKVAYREGNSGRDRILLTHLFESFDIPADESIGGPVRFRVPAALVPVLAQSSRWGRIKAEIVCAMFSNSRSRCMRWSNCAGIWTVVSRISGLSAFGTSLGCRRAPMSGGTTSSNA